MTEQQQREACAELARRMGWTLESDGHWQAWRSPDGGIRRNVRPSYDEFPVGNFFTDPAASRELVAWLVTDRDRMFEFCRALKVSLGVSNGLFTYELIEKVITAPLPVIAKAACKALGIEVSE